MDYQVTCICGHQFLVNDEKIKAPVACPACGQRLSPVIEASIAPPLPTADTIAAPAQPDSSAHHAAAEATKRCPYCGEVILAIARKCKHCGEFLDRPAPAAFATDNSAATASAASAASIEPVFELSVSQWDNFWKFLILLTLVLAAIAALVLYKPFNQYKLIGVPSAIAVAALFAWYFYLAAKNSRVIVRPNRIDTETGILAKDLNSLELFRISDMELRQGLIERMLGIGTVRLMTNGSSSEPELELYQIPRAREVFKYIQNQIPQAAKQRGAVYLEK